jgi:hypothetical protein
MQCGYDQKAWEKETGLGRRLYIHNFGMTGAEFAGWELIDTTVARHSTDESEKVFMWKRQAGEGEELVQVRVIETAAWRKALAHHHDLLARSTRTDIPRGKGLTAGIGDIQHVGQAPTKETVTVIFTRGNLQVSVSSVGLQPVDVIELAQTLDDRLTMASSAGEEKITAASGPHLLQVKALKQEKTPLIETLPAADPQSGWTRFLAEEGEICREADTLYIIDQRGGDRTVEAVNHPLQ